MRKFKIEVVKKAEKTAKANTGVKMRHFEAEMKSFDIQNYLINTIIM
jgi:hypothetical protein